MRVYEGLDQVKPEPGGTVLTIGNFDGVHRAHQRLIETARTLTTERCPTVTVLTFEPHPLSVVAPGREPERLTTPDQKLELLERAGVDIVVVARSEAKLLAMEPEAFIQEVVQTLLGPSHIVEGSSFGFGKGRRGDTNLLERIASGFGCTVHVVDEVTVTCDQGVSLVVSSSLIRDLLARGDVARAALCLGRPYELSGRVVSGDGRGRTIGFPTANVAPDRQLVPAEGVYAGTVWVDRRRFAAGISIGRTPTFEGTALRIEAHLLDFKGDLYDRKIAMMFEGRLRSQEKFASAAALVEQIAKDMAKVRAFAGANQDGLSKHSPIPTHGD